MADDGMTIDEKRQYLKEIKQAMYTGALRVKFNERDTTFRSLDEMRQIISALEEDIAKASGRKPVHVTVGTFGTGL